MKYLLSSLLISLAFTSCLETFDTEESVDSTQSFEANVKNPWVPPAALVKKSLAFDYEYVGAGPWKGESGCGGSFLEGSRFLRDWVQLTYSYAALVGGYSCRHINGDSKRMSVHATGRAIDIHIPLDGTKPNNALGDPIANYLLDHAEEMGIQIIIWDGWVWSMGQKGAKRSRRYGGKHPHNDHIHTELTPQAAQKDAPWFKKKEIQDLLICETSIPAKGLILDNEGKCFHLFGKEKYWRTEQVGYKGTLRWTNAFKTTYAKNWARWMFNFEEAGTYTLYYYSVPKFAKFNSTQIRVRNKGSNELITLDLSAATEEGWQELGSYDFEAGADQWVSIYDNSPIDVADDQHVIADAIKIVNADIDPNENNATNNGSGESNTGSEKPSTNNEQPTPQPQQKSSDEISVDEGCTMVSGSGSFLLLFVAFFAFIRKR